MRANAGAFLSWLTPLGVWALDIATKKRKTNFSAVTEETKGLLVNVCAQQGARSTFAVKGLEN